MKVRYTLLLLALQGLRAASTLYVATDIGPYKSTDSGATFNQLTVKVSNPLVTESVPGAHVIAVDPLHPTTVYFIADGFYKSTDAGATWTAVVTIGYTLLNSFIAIDPVKTNVIYALAIPTTGSNVILKSSDAGATWAPTTHVPIPTDQDASGFPDGVSVSWIATDPSTSGALYAVADDTIYKTTDFGNTWSQIAGQKSIGGAAVSKVWVDPVHSHILYAVSDPSNCGPPNGFKVCGLLKSADGGNTWAQLAGLASTEVYSLTIDSSSGAIYAGADVNGIGVAAMKSTDGGTTWTPLYNKFDANGDIGIILEVDPNTPSTIYSLPGLGVNGMFKSVDGGATWALSQFSPGCDPYVVECGVTFSAHNFVVAPAAPTPPPPPVISGNGVVNGASFAPGVVPNSWVTILGTNLAVKPDDWSNSIVNGQFPTTLDGVSVEIGGKPAYIYYISAGQINVLVPDIGFGSQQVIVTTPGGVSNTLSVTSNQFGPAFFLWPNNQSVATRQDFSYAVKNGTFAGTTTVAAKPGDVIILWGTGFGLTSPAAPEGTKTPSTTTYNTANAVSVSIGGKAATVYGAALASGYAGLYQIAIQVPAGLANGDYPVVATVGGVSSPSTTLITVQR